jgi:hypothetical protein
VILSDIVSDYLKRIANEIVDREGTEVKSTEEMCALIEEVNRKLSAEAEGLGHKEIKLMKEIVVGSKDAKALYTHPRGDHKE